MDGDRINIEEQADGKEYITIKEIEDVVRRMLGRESVLTAVTITRTDKPNSISFRWGGTGTDVKLYFNDAEDLEQQLQELGKKGNGIRDKISDFCRNMNEG